MPKKFGQQTRRLKGGDIKKLKEKRNAVNKELAELIEKQKKATEEGDPTATLQAMIRDLQAKKKYLNRSETRVAEREAKKAAAKEEANIAAAAKEQANMELEQNAFAEENAALNAATAAAKKQANMEAEQNGVLNAALEAEENIDAIAKEAAATERNNSSNNGTTNSISNNGSTVMTNNGNTVMTNNGSTVMTNYNADTCPTIDADDFKTQTHLGANFLSLYGCFMLEGYDTKLCNPSGLLLKFHELSTIQLNNKAEAAIYIYLLNYKDTFNAILESTISNDKKIRKIIILRETTVRVLIHSFAYYALLCSDANNDMVKQDAFSNLTNNFSPNTDNTIKPKAKTDTIISHYFSGETAEAIIKAHITSLFSIENIEKLAMDLFSKGRLTDKFILLEILEQNAYATVLQTFIEIEEELVNSDISDTLLKIYMDEENSEVLKYFKAELIEGLKDKKAEDVLYNDILYSITISPVRFTSLRELAKKIISDIGNKTDDDLKPENGDNPPSPTDEQSCEDDRDLCLGTDIPAPPDTPIAPPDTPIAPPPDTPVAPPPDTPVAPPPDTPGAPPDTPAPDASLIKAKNDVKDLKDKIDKQVTRIQEINDIITNLSKTINKNTNSTDTVSKITEVLRQTIAMKERVETYYGDAIQETKINDIEKKITQLNKSYTTIISLSISAEKLLIKIHKLSSNFILRELTAKGKNVSQITNNMNNSLEDIVQKAFEIKGNTEENLEHIQDLSAQVEAFYNKHKAMLS